MTHTPPAPPDAHPTPTPAAPAPSMLRVVLVLLMLGAVAWALLGRPSHSGGDGAVTWEHDVPTAQQTAATEAKPVLMFFTADWCPPCRQLKAGPLSQPDLAAQIEHDFVPVKIDMTDNNNDVSNRHAAAYGVQGIPTLIATAADGTELGRTPGGSASDLTAWLNRYAPTPTTP